MYFKKFLSEAVWNISFLNHTSNCSFSISILNLLQCQNEKILTSDTCQSK